MEIVEGDRSELAELYRLASSAIAHDTFSIHLLDEKLFQNPCPDQDQYRVLLAKEGGEIIGFMQAVSRPAESRAWLGLFATASTRRRQQVASILLQHIVSEWRASGIRHAEALAMPGNYFTPGIDPRYTESLCLLEHHGFKRFADCANLLAPLDQSFETAAEERRLADIGVRIRRATADDGDLLDAFFAGQFGPAWRLEAESACRRDPPALHLAIENHRIVAFSAHSSQNREWGFFGPMGTAPASRGKSLGRVLLWKCLNDLRDAGHRTAVIPWVGPIGFYARYAGCRVERVFWRYRLTMNTEIEGTTD